MEKRVVTYCLYILFYIFLGLNLLFGVESLNDRISKKSISLGKNPSFLDVYMEYYTGIAEGLSNGGIILGWNNDQALHLRFYNKDITRVTKELKMNGYYLINITNTDENSVLLLVCKQHSGDYLLNAFRTELELFVIKMDYNGNIHFQTSIVGGNGRSAGKDWFIWHTQSSAQVYYNGTVYAVFAQISHNWAKNANEEENIHQGDYYVELDKNGKIIEEKTQFWSASHSFSILMSTTPGGDFYTVTSGDSYPFGLYFINRSKNIKKVVWPENASKQEIKRMKDENYSVIGAGTNEDLIQFGNDSLFLLSRSSPNLPIDYDYEESVNPIIFKLDSKGNVLEKRWLSEGRSYFNAAFGARYGDNILIGLMDLEYPARVTLTMLDRNLKTIIPPQKVEAYYVADAKKLFHYANGDIGWILFKDEGKSVDIYRLRLE